jgi:putative DNA primase/helicase
MFPRYTTMNQIKDAVWQWQSAIKTRVEALNPSPLVINVKNGLYNVLDDTLSGHTPEYLSTIQLNARYDPTSKCPRFEQFLHEALDEGDIPLIQEMFGYCLVPINRAQKSFVLVGEPGAGKSKLLLTLNQILLGQRNVSNIPWQYLSERFNKAELFGKLANIFSDLPTKNIYDNGVFKALVGEDFVNAERKGRDPFSFQPTARLLFSCNSIPRNYGDKSEGFYRRLIIIRFTKSVPTEKRDPMLLDKFAAEADGILMFAIAGLKRLIARDFQFSESERSRAELEQYRIDSNSALSFISDMCEIRPEVEIERMELYIKYKDYCKASGLIPYSQKAFHRDIELNYPTVRRAVDRLGKRRTWRGLRVVEGGVT